MSGAKTSSYVVVETAAQREARERRALDSEADRVDLEIRKLTEHVARERAAYGEAISVPGLSLDRPAALGEYRSCVQRARSEVETARQRLGSEVQAARVSAIVASLRSGAAGGSTKSADELLSEVPKQTQQQEEDREWRDRISTDVARVRGRLDADASDEVLERADELTVATLATDDSSLAGRGVDALRLLVSEENERCERHRLAERESADLIARLAQLQGGNAEEMRARLAEMAERGERPGAAAGVEVDLLVAAETKRSERSLVAGALRDVLGTLGYSVGDGFETELLERGYVDASRSDWKGYGVRVQMPEGAQAISMNVVRGESADPAQSVRDEEVERFFCSDYASMRDALPDLGVDLTLISAAAPGEIPVQVVHQLPAIGGGRASAAKRVKRERAEEL